MQFNWSTCCAITFWKTKIFPVTCFVKEIGALFQFLLPIILTKKKIRTFFKKPKNPILGSFLALSGQKMANKNCFKTSSSVIFNLLSRTWHNACGQKLWQTQYFPFYFY